jgi:hypothetical protein
MNIYNIQTYTDFDPFFVESNLISFQRIWRYNKYHKNKNIIIKNINNLINHYDPITLNYFFESNKINNINNLYPIIIRHNMYIYEIDSLNEIIKEDKKEVFSNIDIDSHHIENIKFLCKNFKVNKLKLTKKEKLFHKKTNIFQIFLDLETYFTLDIYEKINKSKLPKILNELRLMWTAFIEDNNINEIELFGSEINWNFKKNTYEEILLKNINSMINNNLDQNFKKTICYIIIGAFSYVDSNIKKIYRNIDFI